MIGPVEEFLGPATLAFLDPTGVHLRETRGSPRSPPAISQWGTWLRPAAPPDAQKSGILAVYSSLAVWQVAGRVVAASGYQIWHGQLGHLSVLVDPAFRDRGLGKAVAARAAGQVVDAGLLPQWRARSTLVASRKIARTLDFPVHHLRLQPLCPAQTDSTQALNDTYQPVHKPCPRQVRRP